MRWLITGADGMLGTDLQSLLGERGIEFTATDKASLDITDEVAVADALDGHAVVVNCAAWTAVDDAEAREDAALTVNALGPRMLARAARRHGSRLVQISTDYVFDGEAEKPYPEDAPLAPQSAYGRTKAAGETAVVEELPGDHLIVRTAWLYGANGACFPKTIARVARERGGLDVVDDQIGQPTWTRDVARVVLDLVEAAAPAGAYHATSSSEASWFEFAQDVVAAADMDRSVVRPTTSDKFVRPAPRPSYSVLGHEALHGLGIKPIEDWRSRWALAADEVLSEL